MLGDEAIDVITNSLQYDRKTIQVVHATRARAEGERPTAGQQLSCFSDLNIHTFLFPVNIGNYHWITVLWIEERNVQHIMIRPVRS